MAWTAYTEPIEILRASDINNIKENIETIKSLLIAKGFDVDNTKSIQANESTQFVEIFDILSNIEYNLDVINDNKAKSVYYAEPKTIGDYASNRDDIWRWMQILNDMYDILNKKAGLWQYIKTLDGFPTIENNKLLTRGDLLG